MGGNRSVEVRENPRNRERVTGVEPATLCLASAATPVTRPSQPIARERNRGFPAPVVPSGGLGWDPIRYNAGTTPGHLAPLALHISRAPRSGPPHGRPRPPAPRPPPSDLFDCC